MGLSPFNSSTSSYDAPALGNPDPRNFRIVRHVECPNATVVEIVYPDSKNYEGRKVLVYHASWAKVASTKVLDPHFAGRADRLSPFARFEPTDIGWHAACSLARTMPPRAK